MSLIILLICLIAERFLLDRQQMRQPHWLDEYSYWFERQELPAWMLNGYGGILALLLPPLLAVALVQQLLDESLFGIPGALFAILVLLFSFGPLDLDDQIKQLQDAQNRQDADRTRQIARELLEDEPPPNEPGFSQALAEAVLVQANQRVFAVIFWFLLLGPIGAVLYRLSCSLPKLQTTTREIEFFVNSKQWLAMLDWIPARLTAATYAIAGSFEDALYGWRNYHRQRFDEFDSSASGILICTGAGALRLTELIDNNADDALIEGQQYLLKSAMGLVWRSLVVWLVLIALFTLAGWI